MKWWWWRADPEFSSEGPTCEHSATVWAAGHIGACLPMPLVSWWSQDHRSWDKKKRRCKTIEIFIITSFFGCIWWTLHSRISLHVFEICLRTLRCETRTIKLLIVRRHQSWTLQHWSGVHTNVMCARNHFYYIFGLLFCFFVHLQQVNSVFSPKNA